MTDLRVEHLRRSPLFSELTRRELGRLARTMSERTFAAGTAVTTEGEVGVGFFIIEQGEASVAVGDRELWRLGPGDHFGEIALIGQSKRTATVTAVEPLTCWTLSSWDFRPVVESNGALAWKLLQAVARLVGA